MNKDLPKYRNQHQQALWYLYNWDKWFSLKDVINDSMFFKFQTRLSEIEAELNNTIALRKWKKFLKGDVKCKCYEYKAIDKNYIKEIYDKF